MLFAARRTIAVDQRHRCLDQPPGQFRRVADGGRGQDELRLRAIKSGNALQAPDDIGDMRAKDAAIGVQFVDDHKTQVAQKLSPQGVMRQDAGMEHVGVAQDDLGFFAHRLAFGLGRIAVINRRRDCKLLTDA